MGALGINGPASAGQFVDLYEELVWKLLRRGVEETNERTGHRVWVHPYGPVSFSIDLGEEMILPVPGNRRVFPATAAAELAWMLMGIQDASFMLKHARVVWEKFLEPQLDGNGKEYFGVKAAYGYRWRSHFGRDQLRLAMDALRANPSDRRIWISAWDPAEDGLGTHGQLNVPCPVGFTLSLVEDRLNSALVLRSSDVFVGLPYDVMGHALLMAAVASSLDVEPGVMHLTLAHPHLYDVHADLAEEGMSGKRRSRVPLDVRWNVHAIEEAPEAFVAHYKAEAARVEWPTFSPKPEVVA